MAYYMTFSALNEKLRPRITTSDRLYSTLNRMEERQVGSMRSFPVLYRSTVLPEINTPEMTKEPEVKQELEDHVQQQTEELTSDLQEESTDSPPLDASVQLTVLSLNNGEEQRIDEEKDVPGELTSSTAGGPSQSSSGEDESPLRRNFDDGTLPDLIRSGRPLGRRRTLGHVSETVCCRSLSVGWEQKGAGLVAFFCMCVKLETDSTNGKTCHTGSKLPQQLFRSHSLLTMHLETPSTPTA